ncbi:MscL family protein [Georgenia muralis]|uniref:Large conductance mechanosensitive channel n=1 Tax=Georgenia muralis TaxID=154117 RepID=A0A3N4ZJY4_9MICO|nr:MscL family protein [Georgenia muralis]RPF26138.1 large conductance mechanosensitive channel [Georgenia muralis]
MKGFKDFIMRGNLVELAVAFIMATAFAAVVTAFTAIVLEALAKAGGAPNFDEWAPGGFATVGPFLTALVAFVILAFVVYFFIVKPYEAAKTRFTKPAVEDEAVAEEIALLREIRDALRERPQV